MNALDTNIWLYSHDARDPKKQAQESRSKELIYLVFALPVINLSQRSVNGTSCLLAPENSGILANWGPFVNADSGMARS